MAITAVNASYFSQGPTQSGQVLANIDASVAGTILDYFATATLDGASTSFTLNFIDGTKTLRAVPRAVTADVVGGTQAAAVALGIATTTPTSTGVTCTLSVPGTAANTVTFAGRIYF